MRKLVLILGSFLLCAIVAGQGTNRYREAWVKVSSDITNEQGVGLIVFERNDSLYIAVPRQFGVSIEGEFATDIQVQHYGLSGSYRYEFFKYSKKDNLTFIRRLKPTGFEWNYQIRTGKLRQGKVVDIIAPADLWSSSPQRIFGTVAHSDDSLARSDFFRLAPEEALPGNLLFRKSKLTGFIYDYKDGEASSITINKLQSYVRGSMYVHDIPLQSLRWSIVALGGVIIPSFDRESMKINGTLGAAMEYGALPRWSMRYGYQRYWLSSLDVVTDEGVARFQHRANMHQWLLAWQVQSSVIRYTQGRLLFGYGVMSMDPQIAMNNGEFES